MTTKIETLRWLAKHIVSWPNYIPSIRPTGWKWFKAGSDGHIVLSNGRESINKSDWTAYQVKLAADAFDSFFNGDLTSRFHQHQIEIMSMNCRCSILEDLMKPVVKSYPQQHEPCRFSYSEMMENIWRQ